MTAAQEGVGTVQATVEFTAACPACGADCLWLGLLTRIRHPLSDQPVTVVTQQVLCDCADVVVPAAA